MARTRPDAGQFRAFSQYVLDRAVDLGLRDWTIRVHLGTDETTHWTAQCERTFARRVADITFAPLVWEQDEDELRSTVLHELLHCHLDPVQQVVKDLEEQLGTFVHSVVLDRHQYEVECAVDAVAEAIAGKYPPVPTWADDDGGPGQEPDPGAVEA